VRSLRPCQGKHHVPDEPLERLVLYELPIDLRVVRQEVLHYPRQSLVVRHPRGVRGVLPRVLVCGVGRNLGRDVVADAPGDPIRVREQGAELVVERLEDVAQLIELRLRLAPTSVGRNGLDFGVRVRRRDSSRRI
jgi:hypothetical protein